MSQHVINRLARLAELANAGVKDFDEQIEQIELALADARRGRAETVAEADAWRWALAQAVEEYGLEPEEVTYDEGPF